MGGRVIHSDFSSRDLKNILLCIQIDMEKYEFINLNICLDTKEVNAKCKNDHFKY